MTTPGDAVPPASDSSGDWQHQLAEHGYAIVPGVLNSRELIAVLVSLADLDRRRGSAGVRHVLSHPTVSVIASDKRLVDMARDILGPNAFPFRATFYDKSPDSNWLTNWHQDTALPLFEKTDAPGWGPWSVKEGVNYAHAPAAALEQVLALRLYLDDSTEKNGPLRVIPGTHGLGVLSDEEVGRHSTYQQGVECLVARGGVVAMRPLIIHASSKSQAQLPRRVLHIEYAGTKEFAGGLRLALA